MMRLTISQWWIGLSNQFRQYALPVATIIIFIALFVGSIVHLLHQSRQFTDQLIVDDIQRLTTIFNKIDDECKILSFAHQKNYIDFLTVATFGPTSEVGAMSLVLPQKWQGPYVKDNPEIQGKVYQIVRTKKGYFVTPGDGVRLGSGRVVGVDIVLDENSDVQALIDSPDGLQSGGKPLAAKIKMSGIGKRNIFDFVTPD